MGRPKPLIIPLVQKHEREFATYESLNFQLSDCLMRYCFEVLVNIGWAILSVQCHLIGTSLTN